VLIRFKASTRQERSLLHKQAMQKNKSYLRTEMLLQEKAVKTYFTRYKPINKHRKYGRHFVGRGYVPTDVA